MSNELPDSYDFKSISNPVILRKGMGKSSGGDRYIYDLSISEMPGIIDLMNTGLIAVSATVDGVEPNLLDNEPKIGKTFQISKIAVAKFFIAI